MRLPLTLPVPPLSERHFDFPAELTDAMTALERAALAAGASPTWAGMPVLTVVLWGGLVTQILWVGFKTLKSGSTVPPFHRSTIPPFHYSTLLSNFFLSALVGVIGVMQFVFQKAGEPMMGDFRYISFAVLMSSAVFFSAILGVALGEWKGTSCRTRVLLASGIVVLAFGFAVMAAGGR